MPTPNPPQPIRTLAATIALGLVLAIATTTPAHATTSTSSATTDLITSIQTLIDTITNTAADENPRPQSASTPSHHPNHPILSSPPNFPKITGDPESIHQVAFSYLRNTDGGLTPITDGRLVRHHRRQKTRRLHPNQHHPRPRHQRQRSRPEKHHHHPHHPGRHKNYTRRRRPTTQPRSPNHPLRPNRINLVPAKSRKPPPPTRC